MKNFVRLSAFSFSAFFYCLMFALTMSISGFSQNVGINTTGAAPNASAGLDVDFPDKGLLIPRIALTGTANYAPLPGTPVAGMIVYNTATAGDVKPGFYYNDGSKWIAGLPAGNAIGDMLYWDGTAWTLLPVGTSGQYLTLNTSNIPSWATASGGGVFATLTTTAASVITGITATSGGNITSDGGLAVLSRGVCWKITSGPTIADSKTVDGTGTGTFTSSLTGLTPVTTYYVRAYSTNSGATTYGNEITFTTTAILPTVAPTTAASAITGTTATTGGNVTNTGGATITERGVCYGIAANPTTANSKVIDPAPGAGAFTSNLTGLTGATLYYVRAYATNSIGTAYGTQISFTTLAIPPTLTTAAPSNIGFSTATSGGTLTWNGGGYSNYMNVGVAYSTAPGSPTPSYTYTNTNSLPYTTPLAPWVTNLTGLIPNTTYYIRSCVSVYRSGWIVVFGPETSFTTTSIQTAAMGAVTATTAISGGTIASNVTTVSARGVCWNTSPSPTIANSHTSDGTSNGTFVSNVTGLTSGMPYFIRAYYTDGSSNTFYGEEYSFTTGTPKVVGDALAGGIIIYVDPTGQHGIVGALVDQGSGVPWGTCATSLNIGIAQGGGAIYAGLNNTNVIIANCGAGTAAQLCAAYTAGGTNLPGITNWYLPSHDELQKLCDQRAIVNLTVTPSYAGSGCLYWSSTEYSSSIAYAHYSLGGIYDYNNYKYATYYSSTSNLMYVRAVRAF